jgi:Kef-type K+ transport system membrane component KefB
LYPPANAGTSKTLPAHNGDMPAAAQIPLSMLLVFASAKLLSEIFERLGQPGIVGEILAGILIGPYVLGWMQPNEVLDILSELGVMFLLFRVGLEVRASELIEVGGTAMLVAIAGVVLPFAGGWGISSLWGQPGLESIFTGAAMVATSVGITAEVLASRGLLRTQAARVILAAAVVDDVLGLIVLSVVSGLAKGRVNYFDIGLTAAISLGFVVLLVTFGTRVFQRLVPPLSSRLSLPEGEFAIGMTLLFALSLLAVYAGVAAIVGAFLAGMALSETTGQRLNDMTSGVSELLVPFFLAGIGLHFNLSAFSSGSTILFATVVILVAVVTKFAGCGLGAIRLGRQDAIRVGVGMVPRGEVGMVVAQIGLNMHIMAPQVYGIIVLMSVATTLVAPPLIRAAFRQASGEPQETLAHLG